MQNPTFFDVYVTLVRSPRDEEIPLKDFARLVALDFAWVVEELLFDKSYDGICTCEFEDPDDPTLDEIEACPCVPVLERNEAPARIEGEDVFMTAGDLASALIEMDNSIGDEIRQGAIDLVVGVIEEATGASEEEQWDMLDTALAHCTEDDDMPLTSLLDNTLEQVRNHFDQNP